MQNPQPQPVTRWCWLHEPPLIQQRADMLTKQPSKKWD